MTLRLDLDLASAFGDDFFFAVGNAPYLVEGGYNVPAGPQNSYGYFERSGTVPPSGDAVDFWTDYQRHVDLAASLGLNAFRMGVEWARVQPTTRLEVGEPPAWDDDAVDHYARILAAVQDAGMRPIVTLHHFTHPAWLGPSMWLDDRGPDLLVDYEVRIVEELNHRLVGSGRQPVRHYVTFNEINLLVLLHHFLHIHDRDQGVEFLAPAYDRALAAHVRIYDGLHDLYEHRGWGEVAAGYGDYCQPAYEIDKLHLDVMRLRSWGVAREDAGAHLDGLRADWDHRIGEIARRKLTPAQQESYRGRVAMFRDVARAESLPRTLDALYASPRARKLDFVSVHVYEPFSSARALGGRTPWWEYAADPEIYRAFVEAYHHGNADADGVPWPIHLGENSLALRQPDDGPAQRRPDGWTRERYLKEYLMAMVGLMADGVPIKGFLYWTLVDEFEWHEGYEPLLGLYGYDHAAKKILPTDAVGEHAGPVYAHLVAALRSGDPEVVQRAFTRAFEPPA